VYDIIAKAEFGKLPSDNELAEFCSMLIGASLARGMVLYSNYYRKDGDIFLRIRTNESKDIVNEVKTLIFQSFSSLGVTPTMATIVSRTRIDLNSKIKVILSSSGLS